MSCPRLHLSDTELEIREIRHDLQAAATEEEKPGLRSRLAAAEAKRACELNRARRTHRA